MNKTVNVVAAIVGGVALFLLGVIVARITAPQAQSYGMMGAYAPGSPTANNAMITGDMMSGMFGNEMYDRYSMMDGDMMNGGMMSGLSGLPDAEPLSIEQATSAATAYLDELNDDNLAVGEVMIFDNHAYVQVVDNETGAGAFELLINPVTQEVFPEPGPNMMWNSEYGMMGNQYQGMMNGGRGMRFGNMMGRFGGQAEADLNVTGEEAVRLAQSYLDTNVPGTTASDEVDAFPGYFTLHVERDGNIAGMLSVNAYDGQVFLHHWHGDFVEMSDENHG